MQGHCSEPLVAFERETFPRQLMEEKLSFMSTTMLVLTTARFKNEFGHEIYYVE